MSKNKIIESTHDLGYISRTKEIPADIAFAITMVMEYEMEKQKTMEDTMKAVSECNYNQVQKLSAINSYLNYNPIEKRMKEYVWDKAPIEVLRKIAFALPFDMEASYYDNIIIPGDILPKLTFKEFASTNPKAEIAKKLGAKIIS